MKSVSHLYQQSAEQHPRILIVDDDRDILESLSDLLELEGNYDVATATDFREAQTLATDFEPDVALIDIKLGNYSGLALISVLKDQFRNIVCIVMTGYRDTENAISALRQGADDYLLKPLQPNNLITLLQHCVERQRFEAKRLTLERERLNYERWFRAIFEQTFQFLFLLGPSGKLLEANQAALRFAGLDQQAMTGLLLWQTLWWDTTVDEQKRLQDAVSKAAMGEFIRYECDICGADGQIKSIDFSLKRVQDGHDEIFSIIGEGRDISERKAAEAALRKAHGELERRVRERTLKLEQTKDESERANRAKSEFLSRVSHELRTPLNAVLGFGELLELEEYTSLTAQQRDWVKRILQGGRHLLELINELLDLARIESGKVEVFLENVALTEVLQECLALIRPLAKSRALQINDHISESQATSIYLRADRRRLKQILLNFLSNAVKYNRDQGELRLTYTLNFNNRVRISISDTGYGISEEDQLRLFEPFERLGASKEVVEGTGIGLALSRQLIRLMGGSIGFESSDRQGSTFWFELDAGELPFTMHPETQTPLPDPADLAGTATESYSVLYIEDNLANLILVADILASRSNIQLLKAMTPGKGLHLAITRQPDLILLDIELPGMNGYEVLEVLRAEERTQHIPVVAISANAMEHDLAKGRAAGFLDYFPKPINIRAFNTALDRYLQQAAVQR